MAMRDLPDMYARSPRATSPRAEGIHIRQIPNGHVTTIMYHFVPIRSNKTSNLNPTGKFHTCSQGYKYKLVMHYSQGIECSHSPTSYVQVTLCIRNQASDCDNALCVGIATLLDQRFIYQSCA